MPKTKDENNFWELQEDFEKSCDNCKWKNEPIELEIGDGNAPCHRCILWDGR